MKQFEVNNLVDATSLCRDFDVDILFTYSDEGSEVDVKKREIIIDLEGVNSLNLFWSLVFHELCHIKCYDEDKYSIFHKNTLPKKEMYQYMLKNGLRIERFVDKMAAKMMKQYLPRRTYKYSYIDQVDIDYFYNWVKEGYE